MKEMFCDKNGKLSPKRVFGVLCIICALIYTVIERGDTEIIKFMFLTGFGALSITVLEKKD